MYNDHEPVDSSAAAIAARGLLLHSAYHRPNGWDQVPAGRSVPCDESSMWGDYHIREAALYVDRLAKGAPYLAFHNISGG